MVGGKQSLEYGRQLIGFANLAIVFLEANWEIGGPGKPLVAFIELRTPRGTD